MSATETTTETTLPRRRLEDLVSGVKDRAERLKGRSLEDLWTGTRDYVKENPGKMILVALAAGVLIGSLVRRK